MSRQNPFMRSTGEATAFATTVKTAVKITVMISILAATGPQGPVGAPGAQGPYGPQPCGKCRGAYNYASRRRNSPRVRASCDHADILIS